MVNFNIIDNINKVPSNREWIDSLNFKNRTDYAGRRYQLIAKHERKFSNWERLARGLLGIWMVVRSFGRELTSKTVKNLFIKDHESRRFGILINQICDETAADFTLLFPKEINLEILSYLNGAELTKCQRVNKTWKALAASHEALWNALPPRMAFGKRQWATYFGDIGKEPPLPKDIHKILKSSCLFWPGKKVEETHMLVLIPESINGKLLTLGALAELVKTPKEGHATKYRYMSDAIINEYGNQAATKSHWVLMTKDVIEGSRNKSYTGQRALVAKFANQQRINYEVPNLLDASIGIFMHYICFGERLFNKWTYTRCQEKAQGCQIVVGCFGAPDSLEVNTPVMPAHAFIGVAAQRQLFF